MNSNFRRIMEFRPEAGWFHAQTLMDNLTSRILGQTGADGTTCGCSSILDSSTKRLQLHISGSLSQCRGWDNLSPRILGKTGADGTSGGAPASLTPLPSDSNYIILEACHNVEASTQYQRRFKHVTLVQASAQHQSHGGQKDPGSNGLVLQKIKRCELLDNQKYSTKGIM